MYSASLIEPDGTDKIDHDFEVAVVGSGFGGSIAAVELAKVFKKHNMPERVCILERGAWHTSPESWPDEYKSKVAEFIADRLREFWAMPDHSTGLMTLLGKLRNLPPTGKFWPIDIILKLIYWSFHYRKNINPYGLYDLKGFSDCYGIVASGVGGGSLIYSGVLALPEREIMEEEYCEPGNLPWKPKWKIKYDELEPLMMYAKYKFIEASKVYSIQAGYGEDFMLSKTKNFQDAADGLKKNPKYDITFELSDLAIKESPTWDLEEGKWITTFCRREGRCNLGCLPGARNTLNKKLAKAAKVLPISIFELAEVKTIRPINDGVKGYEIEFFDWRPQPFVDNDKDERRRRITRTGRQCKIRVQRLILAAGTYGTTELILRSKENFKDLNYDVTPERPIAGTRLSVNGDTYAFMTPTRNAVYSTRGPINTAQMRFGAKDKQAHRFTIEDASIPRMVASVFATVIEAGMEDAKRRSNKQKEKTSQFSLFLRLGRYETGFDRTIFKGLGKFVRKPRSPGAKEDKEAWDLGMVEKSPKRIRSLENFAKERYDELADDYRVSRLASFGGMGVDRAKGVATWIEETGLDITWPKLLEDPIFEEIEDGMSILAEKIVDPLVVQNAKSKDEYLITKPWKQLFKASDKIFTLHPLGGCPMETCGNSGAVDEYGRLLTKKGRYENIYVVDGSIVPTALGVNPSLTISGLAFRITDFIIKEHYKRVLDDVVEGEIYDVTIREKSKRKDKSYMVATVNPVYTLNGKKKVVEVDEAGEIKKKPEWWNEGVIEKKDYDHIVYVTDINSGLQLPRQARVKVDRSEGRVVYASVEQSHMVE